MMYGDVCMLQKKISRTTHLDLICTLELIYSWWTGGYFRRSPTLTYRMSRGPIKPLSLS